MIDHVSIGVRDLAKAVALYEPLLSTLGHRKLTEEPGTVGFGKKYPEFWLNHRPNLAPQNDNGTHVCLRCESMDAVNAFHATALAHGANSSGAPGLRPEYSENYYAAFITDTDGNKIEVVTFVA